MDFVSCRTCKFYSHQLCSQIENYIQVNNNKTNFLVKKPDQFFCSEHKTADGTKFVNFGEK